MSYPLNHPPDWALEMLAEGALPPDEQAEVAAHLEACPHCAAEVDGYCALFAALSGLPRFAPSPGFADAVMNRVAVTPRYALVPDWLRRWLPSTSRGWTLLVAALLIPVLPLLALLGWTVSQTPVSPAALAQWGATWLRQTGWAVLDGATRGVVRSAAWQWGQELSATLTQTPPDVLLPLGLLLALAIPLSAWSLIHLLRTPVGGAAHA